VKKTFLICLGGLIATSALLYRTLPEKPGGVPVITWMTDNDEMRRETVALFHGWLAAQGLPPVDLRISQMDKTPRGPFKGLIQGVSGVADDMTDVYTNQLEMFQTTGMLLDLTAAAQRGGFGPEMTYPGVRSDFVLEGRQYGFPRSVDATMCWINRDTFARYGIPEPPARWNWDQFEELGRRFVAAANPPGTRQRVFFLNRVWLPVLRRGLGLSVFNETMTRCLLDDPRNAEVLRREYRWTVTERLMPTEAEQYSLVADASGYDSSFALFASGRFAMIYEGLWALIRLRPMGEFRLRAVEPFSGGFPNTELTGGTVSVYAGSRHPDLAFELLRFLTSEPYNLLVARSADSLPPVPAYTKSPEFLSPAGRPGEQGVPAAFAAAASEIGIAASKSPFVLPNTVFRIDREESEEVLAGRISPEMGARTTAARVNAEIALTVEHDAALRRLFAERQETQRRIDARRAASRPVPAAWISDPFDLAYYRTRGWLEKEGSP